MTRHPLTRGNKAAIHVWQTELNLDKGNHLRLRAAQDMQLSSVRGMAWITVEMDAGETVVCPGDVFVISSGKTALVGAIRGSVTLELGIASRTLARAARRPFFEKLRQFLRPSYGLSMGAMQ